ncbi:MAG: carboxypeptidase M32 [Armatimonadetes bacterium]|nr:carboxypeptidase M32 [Armatimonadota bacterium]
MENYAKLLARMKEIGHLSSAAAVLGWDQQCYMPPGGAPERAEQLALLGTLAHEKFTDESTGALLAAAEAEVALLDDGSDEKLTLRVLRRDYDQAVKIPASLVAELAKAEALGHEVWVQAREKSDFAHFAPTLEKILELSRQKAQYLGYEDHPYNALLDRYEPGATVAQVDRVFAELRGGLVELVAYIKTRPQVSDKPLRRGFPEQGQRTFAEAVIAKMGFDFDRGRQDKAVHPFCTSFGKDDVRITTRYETDWLPAALMGTIHETGHALYEQGFQEKDTNTPLGGAVSLGIHESQSRLWENIVGRSRAFWDIHYGELQLTFPGALDDVSVNDFYRAINKVEPSFIRVEADEATYCLHVMLRYEIEKRMVAGELAVADVPGAWNALMEEYLGVTPDSDANGCLQDVHWSSGLFGYFPTYALGTMLASQLYDKATGDNPQIKTDLNKGEFASLLAWLRTNVHAPGRRYLPAELVERVCGEPAQSRSYLKYLNDKFRAIYE